MVFNSLEYAVFLPVVLGTYWLLRHRAQNALLLVASYVFYAMWDWRFLGLMLLSTSVDYTVGRKLDDTRDDRSRRHWFAGSLIVNLGVLGYFKYAGFFVDSAADLLRPLGIDSEPTLRILLPVGISFYTFHGISYTFDVYRRHLRPATDLLSFAVFVAYFPQLVAGPIGRAHLQLPQFEHERRRPGRDAVRAGLTLIVLGLFQKVVIADALASTVDAAFGSSDTVGWKTGLVGVYAFALQIYGDFCGYSHIARGTSKLFGIELPRNFDQPYLSRNITEFWRTWHISLSTWLRDYLYVPLGGNRSGPRRTERNLLVTMVIGGLWHGAAWTFVAWGAIHGVLLATHRRIVGDRRGPRAAIEPQPAGVAVGAAVAGASGPPPGADQDAGEAAVTDREPWTERPTPPLPPRRDLLRILATFHLVVLAWVPFRAASLADAGDLLRGIATFRGGSFDGNSLVLLLGAAAASFGIDLAQRAGRREWAILRWPPVARGLALGAAVVAIVVFTGGTPVPFIYFQF
jgi:D-alanyl-lipoteichoic acid acyltransferase DltB (MBOAT superfamily)